MHLHLGTKPYTFKDINKFILKVQLIIDVQQQCMNGITKIIIPWVWKEVLLSLPASEAEKMYSAVLPTDDVKPLCKYQC